MSYKLNQEKMTVSNTGKIATAAQADSATSASEINYSSPVATLYPGITEQNTTTTTRTQGTFVIPPVNSVSTIGGASSQSIVISDTISTSNAYGSLTVSGGLRIETNCFSGLDDDFSTIGDFNVYLTGFSGPTTSPSLYIGSRRNGLGADAPMEYSSVFIDASSARIAGIGGGTVVGASDSATRINGGGAAGGQNIRFHTGLSNTTVAYFNQTSTYAYKLAGTAWTVFSDARLKKNIRPVNNALDKIIALNPVHYEYINSGEGKYPTGTRTGFLAQEVEQVLPGHITEQEPVLEEDKAILGEGVNAKTLDADWIPYLVKAIQELKAELDTVKAELATLKG